MDADPLKKLYGKDYAAGATIFREGEPGNKFYLIHSGRVRIIKALGQSQEVVLTTFQDGDFFGEMALFELETRSASAVAETDTTVYELGQRNFENFILNKPRVAYEIMQKLCQRIRKLNELTVDAQTQRGDFKAAPDPRLLLLLVGACGQAKQGFVVARPKVDIGQLSAYYQIDLAPIAQLLSGMSVARLVTDVVSQSPAAEIESHPELKRILAQTLVGAEVVDSRKGDGGE